MVLGVVDALRGLGKTGKVKVVGHDGTPEALARLQEGSISADVSQYPYVMGRMAVEACVAAARGERAPARVDAPIAAFPKPVVRYSNPFGALLD
jgi:ABC-type sugar transport system substrate-binding protein